MLDIFTKLKIVKNYLNYKFKKRSWMPIHINIIYFDQGFEPLIIVNFKFLQIFQFNLFRDVQFFH